MANDYIIILIYIPSWSLISLFVDQVQLQSTKANIEFK